MARPKSNPGFLSHAGQKDRIKIFGLRMEKWVKIHGGNFRDHFCQAPREKSLKGKNSDFQLFGRTFKKQYMFVARWSKRPKSESTSPWHLWRPLASLLWKIHICVHWVFCTKLISEQEAFFDIIPVFGRVEPLRGVYIKESNRQVEGKCKSVDYNCPM